MHTGIGHLECSSMIGENFIELRDMFFERGRFGWTADGPRGAFLRRDIKKEVGCQSVIMRLLLITLQLKPRRNEKRNGITTHDSREVRFHFGFPEREEVSELQAPDLVEMHWILK